MTDTPEKKPGSIYPIAIAGALIAVAIGLGIVAYIAVTNPSQLVRPDYYDAELAHQDKIDTHKRTSELTTQPTLENSGGTLNVRLGADWKDKASDITIKAYRPNDASQDFVMTPTFTDGLVALDLSEKTAGRWKFSLEWTMDGQAYAIEKELYLE